MEGWVSLVGRPIVDTLPTKWSHVNHRSGIDQGMSASRRPTSHPLSHVANLAQEKVRDKERLKKRNLKKTCSESSQPFVLLLSSDGEVLSGIAATSVWSTPWSVLVKLVTTAGHWWSVLAGSVTLEVAAGLDTTAGDTSATCSTDARSVSTHSDASPLTPASHASSADTCWHGVTEGRPSCTDCGAVAAEHSTRSLSVVVTWVQSSSSSANIVIIIHTTDSTFISYKYKQRNIYIHIYIFLFTLILCEICRFSRLKQFLHCYAPTSIPTDTLKPKFYFARYVSTSRQVRRVKAVHLGCVELVEQHGSTHSTWRARLAWHAT